MPLYEYQCDSCGHQFEVIQKFSDALIETCPACSGKVRKLQSSPAIQFKGSGWYITDYARKDNSATEKASGPKDGAPKDSAPKDSGDTASAPSSSPAASTTPSTPANKGASTPSAPKAD